MLNISIVSTVLNEEKEIKPFLNSLVSQTKKPDEIIIVDAGSSDKTQDLIKEFQKKHKSVKLIIEPGLNRSKGRNLGIKKADNQIIAVTDAGCLPRTNWLEELTLPFKNPSIDVASGFYQPIANSVFEKCYSAYTCFPGYKLTQENFLPSSRSIAFRKSSWTKVGGYPEELSTCEDLVFASKLRRIGAEFVLAKNAIVEWRQESSLTKAFKKLFNYAKGDAQALYLPHLKKSALVWLRYIAGFLIFLFFPPLLLFLFPQYIAWSIGKSYWRIKDKRAFIILPLLQITADLAVISGTIFGLISRLISFRR